MPAQDRAGAAIAQLYGASHALARPLGVAESCTMHLLALAQAVALIGIVNCAPLVAKKVFRGHFDWPVDFAFRLRDGRRLFGPSKTIRGVLVAILSSAAAAPLLGLDVALGARLAALAMAGDLLSSFLKRRLGLAPSSQAIGLDQVPESLFPLLGAMGPLELTAKEVVAGVFIFLPSELLISRLLFRAHLRDQPY